MTQNILIIPADAVVEDYIAMAQRFHRESVIGEMDCFLSRWTTAEPGGFTES